MAATDLTVNPTSDPRLIVARRDSGRLVGNRVDVHQDAFDDIRKVVDSTVQILRSSEERHYDPFAALDKGEQHFKVAVDDLPTRPAPISKTTANAAASSSADGGGAVDQTASLLSIINDPDGLPKINAAGLNNENWLFYGIVMDSTDAMPVTFIRKQDPIRVATHGRVFLRWGGTLRRQPPPDFALQADIDMVATQQALYVLTKSSFDQILNDVYVVTQDVPKNVAQVSSALSGSIPLSSGSAIALERLGYRRPSIANRLRLLPGRLAEIEVTPDKVRAALAAKGDDPDLVLTNGKFTFDESAAPLFLDLVEGRLYADEWTSTQMRADRMSKHVPRTKKQTS